MVVADAIICADGTYSLTGFCHSVEMNSTRRRHEVEDEAEDQVDLLRGKISTLKAVSIDIGNEVKEHNRFLEAFDDDMNKSEGLLRKAIGRVLKLHQAGHHRYIWWLFLFSLLVFFIIYVLMKFK